MNSSKKGRILIFDDEHEWQQKIKETIISLEDEYEFILTNSNEKAEKIIREKDCVLAILNIFQEDDRTENDKKWQDLAEKSDINNVPIFAISDGFKDEQKNAKFIQDSTHTFSRFYFAYKSTYHKTPKEILNIAKDLTKYPTPLSYHAMNWLEKHITKYLKPEDSSLFETFLEEAGFPEHIIPEFIFNDTSRANVVKKIIKELRKYGTQIVEGAQYEGTYTGLFLYKIYRKAPTIPLKKKCCDYILRYQQIKDTDIIMELKNWKRNINEIE